MKKILLAFAMSTLAACGAKSVTDSSVSSVSADLAGQKFCRMVSTGGLFGQPVGQRKHCINFIDSVNVIDNATTFFGNPPQSGTYSVAGRVVSISMNGSSSDEVYILSNNNKTLTNSDNTAQILNVESSAALSLVGKNYCRMVSTGGLFGQPVGTREHCIKFLDSTTAMDNADTFFGNAPRSSSYAISGQTITLTTKDRSSGRNSVEKYTLSADASTITGSSGAVLTVK